MGAKLKTVHITLTPQIAELLDAEVAAGRFANLSEAVRNAAWKAFAEDPAAELRAAFSQLDESPDEPTPDSAAIAAEIRAWRARRFPWRAERALQSLRGRIFTCGPFR